MRFRFFDFKAKRDLILVLDIGTTAVKALIFEKKDRKAVVLGACLEYFERFSVFDGLDFETDVIKKAILKAIEEVQAKTNLSVDRRKPKKVVLELPANILKGKIISYSLKRKNPKESISKIEQRQIYQKALRESQKALSQQFARESGVLPQDIHFLCSEILEKRIDGYQVPGLYRYQGKILDFKILFSFVPIYYWQIVVDKILPILNFKEVKISKGAQNFQKFLLREITDGIFIDVGAKITQIFLAKDGKLKGISEFKGGGRFFSQSLSETFGLNEREARVWKEKYSNNLFSKTVKERIKTVFLAEQKRWYLNLKSALKKINPDKLLPSNIFLFGEGSLLPEISEVLKKNLSKDLFFVSPLQVKFLFPKDLKSIEIPSSLNNLQYTPCLLNSYDDI